MRIFLLVLICTTTTPLLAERYVGTGGSGSVMYIDGVRYPLVESESFVDVELDDDSLTVSRLYTTHDASVELNQVSSIDLQFKARAVQHSGNLSQSPSNPSQSNSDILEYDGTLIVQGTYYFNNVAFPFGPSQYESTLLYKTILDFTEYPSEVGFRATGQSGGFSTWVDYDLDIELDGGRTLELVRAVLPAFSFDLSSVPPCDCDLDEDEDVDGQDFLAWQRDAAFPIIVNWNDQFGSHDAETSIGIVPEPSSILIAVALTAFFASRRELVR